MSRNERRVAEKGARQSVAKGLDPSNLDEYVMVELVRQVHERLEQAKRQGVIDAL
jgi:hypothetical protein